MNGQSAQSSAPWNRSDGWFARIGVVAGWGGFVAAFLAVYIAAIALVGWIFGLALGWIPAFPAAWIASVLLRQHWWWIAIAAAIVGAMAALGLIGIH